MKADTSMVVWWLTAMFVSVGSVATSSFALVLAWLHRMDDQVPLSLLLFVAFAFVLGVIGIVVFLWNRKEILYG